MHGRCEHHLTLENSWLSGPRIVCQCCGKRWEVRGKMPADACCWGLEIILLALSPLLFGDAVRAFASYGRLSGWIGFAIICMLIGPLGTVVHFAVFTLGHWVHGWMIRRSGDLNRWMIEAPYHPEM